ncbi:MAG: NAD(P)/FAD-dependent oxidoreductase [Gammaproteobacteria bacterium]|nr:NAD(P)/FAD-dependent oxidoreductase [Gammaproteobacteria bacterium]
MRYDTLIVGAGFAGLYMLHRLRGLGHRARVLEAAAGVGGTWYHNRYPGARCDVQSMDYSFSFSEELQNEWDWSEKYATQPEILRYANFVADRLDLRRDIQFETRVESARYDEGENLWRIETDTGEVLEARYYVIATGCLSVPKAIDIEGTDDFQGQSYHTADWPREGVDFSGLRVAVIGTGSSAVQSIPIIAGQARELTVFQRTPAYSLPAFNRPLDEAERATWRAEYPEHRRRSRYSLFGVPDYPMDKGAFDVSDEERAAAYEAAWQTGTLIAILQQYNDLLVDEKANETAAEFVRNKIRGIVEDPEVAETLCPKSFPIGTKRACLDTNYYQTFNLPHVHLVDVRKTPIERVTARGVKTADQEREFDAIVYATGFDAMTGAIVNVDVRGRGGRELKDKWADGPRTYLGLTVSDFPNLFMITGPGSPSVMSNMIISIEQHVDWICDCLSWMAAHGYDTVEAGSDAEQGWVEHVNEVANATLFPQANSWYMGANVPGKPRLFLPYIGGVGPYRVKCEEVAAADYEGFRFGQGGKVGATRPAAAG